MNKKFLITLAPLLAIAAFAVMPVAAQAEPHWYKNGASSPEGVKVQTISWGTITLTSAAGTVTCKKSDATDVENPVGGGAGKDSTVLFDLYECVSPQCPFTTIVKAAGLPWPTELTEEVAGVIRDTITGISLTVECIGTKGEVLGKVGPFTGTLTPKIVNGKTATKPSFDEFGAGSGSLPGAGAGPVTQTLLSSETNSLCINPVSGFEPEVGGKLNYAPLTTAHSPKGTPFPDEGSACEPPSVTHPIAMAGPEKAVFPYSGTTKGSWVSINATGEDGSNPAPKYYIYDATFTLCAAQLANTTLKGHMFADNTVGAFINGEPISSLATGLFANHENFDVPPGPAGGHPFPPSGSVSGPFNVGVNTLQFVVMDETAAYTALDFDATVTSESSCLTGTVTGTDKFMGFQQQEVITAKNP